MDRYAQDRRRIEGVLFFGGFAACVPLANFLVASIGTTCIPNGPCLIPVAPGLHAPSGVLVIGLAFVLRDLVQRRLGWRYSLFAIAIGALLSTLVAPPSLVLASTVAFAVSEIADFCVYTPLARRRFLVAVFASSLVGLVLDSAIFLLLAFGSLDYFPGQVIGKAWMVLAALPFAHWLRTLDRRRGIEPAF